MAEGAVFLGECGDFLNRLDDPGFVVGVHDADEADAALFKAIFEPLEINDALGVDGDELGFAGESGVEDAVVFDTADQHGACWCALDGEIVGFGAAAGENDAFGAEA